MALFQRILAATDFSPESEAALEEACRLAAGSGSKLVIVHAYQIPILASLDSTPPAIYEDFQRAVRADAEKRLEGIVGAARARGVDASALLRDGFPDEEILAAADREKAQLVVMGTHGRRGASRLLLGSIASRVVCRSTCPVMTVRAAAATRPG